MKSRKVKDSHPCQRAAKLEPEPNSPNFHFKLENLGGLRAIHQLHDHLLFLN